MRLGACCHPAESSLVEAAGFDFLEWPAATVLAPDIGPQWVAPRAVLPVEAFNNFLCDVALIGPKPTEDGVVKRYVETICQRASSVGASIVVFGSSEARSIPLGISRRQAEEQLHAFLHLCADAAEANGIVIALEPLNRHECNFVNTLSEGAAWVRRVHRPGLGLLADTFHMQVEGDPIEELEEWAEVLVHVHTADTDRRAPGWGSYPHKRLLDLLGRIGYRGRLSVECRWQDMAIELPEALRCLRRQPSAELGRHG